MTETVSVSRDIAAPAEKVWAMVSDMTRMGEWSPENETGEWIGGATGPRLGAKFRGTNRIDKKKWKTLATVVEAEPGRAFSFSVRAMGLKVSVWRYAFEPTPAGCRVTESWTDKRIPFVKPLGKLISGIGDRVAHNRAGMEKTLERLGAAAESNPSS